MDIIFTIYAPLITRFQVFINNKKIMYTVDLILFVYSVLVFFIQKDFDSDYLYIFNIFNLVIGIIISPFIFVLIKNHKGQYGE